MLLDGGGRDSSTVSVLMLFIGGTPGPSWRWHRAATSRRFSTLIESNARSSRARPRRQRQVFQVLAIGRCSEAAAGTCDVVNTVSVLTESIYEAVKSSFLPVARVQYSLSVRCSQATSDGLYRTENYRFQYSLSVRML